MSLQSVITALNPIAYWTLLETSGVVAVNYGTLGIAANGLHSNTVLAQVDAPNGGKAPYFNGTNSYVNIYSAALAASFNGSLGSAISWWKASDMGVWSDGSNRYHLCLMADANNELVFFKSSTDNAYATAYVANGGAKLYADSLFSNTAWHCTINTWSKADDKSICYIDGALKITRTLLGVWSGALGINSSLLGANNGLVEFWKGYSSHIAVFDKVLTATDVLNIYNAGMASVELTPTNLYKTNIQKDDRIDTVISEDRRILLYKEDSRKDVATNESDHILIYKEDKSIICDE